MERVGNQDNPNPSLFPTTSSKEDSLRKSFAGAGGGGVGGGGGGDRLKRDEWSEGAVESLLEAYESKWVLRNRAKLKGHDWEDVARHVSSRANGMKSPKTQTQCKNKIESMKKRYRSESAAADGSSWPLFSRLDHLLRGSVGPPPSQTPVPPPPLLQPLAPVVRSSNNPALILLEGPPTTQPPPEPPAPPPAPPAVPDVDQTAENSQRSDDIEHMDKQDDGRGAAKLSDQESDKNPMETDSSTPAMYSNKDGFKLKNKMNSRTDNKRKKRKREDLDIAESIRWLAEAMLKSEQARMDTIRELERMRVEAEAKKGEMDLRRTEIIANTQLEIARLFASSGRGVDSSLRIGRS
ncbi:hypothetical protein Ancab_032004 [Ancistrocladus abbreviatus]